MRFFLRGTFTLTPSHLKKQKNIKTTSRHYTTSPLPTNHLKHPPSYELIVEQKSCRWCVFSTQSVPTPPATLTHTLAYEDRYLHPPIAPERPRSSPPRKRVFAGCSSLFMRLAQHPHGASRLMQVNAFLVGETPKWSVQELFIGMRGSTVSRLRPCVTWAPPLSPPLPLPPPPPPPCVVKL